ncbi:MAG: signal peptidase II [Kiritimatiellae bacterium]|nr:signal peptidase II [Kiritimatiellia bacterium]
MRVLSLSFVIVVLDQWLKLLIRQKFHLGESLPVIPGYFNLTYLRNTGAVWGILQHQNEWLVVLSFGVLILMAVFYRWLVDDRRVHCLAIGCMIGGIIGNLIDRIKLGWVIDFLDFHWAANHWPCFNLADAAICVGVAIYAVSTLWMSTVRRAKVETLADSRG